MVFSGFTFLLLFLPASVLCTLAVPGIRGKNAVLCLFSLLFYAWGEPVYVLLMLASILVNYFIGLGMARFPARRKCLLLLAVILNLGAIGWFKYADFLIGSVNSVFSTRLPLAGVALPIGISFYTFQILSYIIDVYRGTSQAQRDPLSLATYISMFPQLIAGPIVRYETVREQLKERRMTREGFADGLARFAIGLGKKVLLANQMALVADAIFGSADVPGAVVWIGAVCYAFQIYFDFSGYSDMAVGMGKMFGFTFPENFNEPYLADSITDFWRRWHISLSTWFREYVYIPMGGNRKGPARQVLNLLTVWMLTGLWHGASWNFVLWGLYYGILLIAEKFLPLHRRLPAWLRHIVTLLLVLTGWVIFRVEDLPQLWRTLGAMFSFSAGGTGAWLMAHADALRPLAVLPAAVLACLPLRRAVRDRLGSRSWFPAAAQCWAYLVWLLSLAMLLGESYNPFIYFRF